MLGKQLLHSFMGLIIGIVCTIVFFSSYLYTSTTIKKSRFPSHKDLNQYINTHRELHFTKFNDASFHGNETSDQLKNLTAKIKILIWVMTSPENLEKKAIHVKKTWGKRVDYLLFMSSKDDPDFPAVGIKTEEGRAHLTAKTMQGFAYVYEHYYEKADWFMKCDDDTFVIIENLRYFLSDKNTSSPVFYGHWFNKYIKQGYHSGGAGYVLSKEALRRFATRKNGTCQDDGGAEDLEMGRCLNTLNVKTGDSRDALGRSRFHCLSLDHHLDGNYPEWYLDYDMFGAQKGANSVSDYPITFHYIPPAMMYKIEYYTYHLRPWGVVPLIPGRALNKPPDKNDTLPASRS